MKAMILAAGRGERMRPLTDHTPKPLLEVGGKALIVHLIERLARGGFSDLVINLAHLGSMIEAAIGNGGRFGVTIAYSPEYPRALETAGGIINALPRLGPEPFLVVNGDLWTDYPFRGLHNRPIGLAHLVLVDNPAHHPEGDFALADGLVRNSGPARLTFSGIGVYRPALFAAAEADAHRLAPLLRDAADQDQVTGEHYRGDWLDVGSPQRLAELDARLRGDRAPGT